MFKWQFLVGTEFFRERSLEREHPFLMKFPSTMISFFNQYNALLEKNVIVILQKYQIWLTPSGVSQFHVNFNSFGR